MCSEFAATGFSEFIKTIQQRKAIRSLPLAGESWGEGVLSSIGKRRLEGVPLLVLVIRIFKCCFPELIHYNFPLEVALQIH
jgi:hypothetical protein